MTPTAAKFGKQIRYADRRGIPYVWFPDAGGFADGSGVDPAGARSPDEVKDIRSGDQAPAGSVSWMPPPADLGLSVYRTERPDPVVPSPSHRALTVVPRPAISASVRPIPVGETPTGPAPC